MKLYMWFAIDTIKSDKGALNFFSRVPCCMARIPQRGAARHATSHGGPPLFYLNSMFA